MGMQSLRQTPGDSATQAASKGCSNPGSLMGMIALSGWRPVSSPGPTQLILQILNIFLKLSNMQEKVSAVQDSSHFCYKFVKFAANLSKESKVLEE
jgi:hypothetical protein